MKRIKRAAATITALALCSVLIISLTRAASVSATVPGVNTILSIGPSGYASGGVNGYSTDPKLSGNGKFAAFSSSYRDLIANETHYEFLTYVRNISTNTNVIASVSTNGTIPNQDTMVNAISRTGRYVLFQSKASNLVDGSTTTTTRQQLYLRDMTTGTTTLISKNASGAIADQDVLGENVSSDGRYVLFFSTATNLDAAATNSYGNLYLLDRSNNSLTVINKAADGTVPTAAWAPYGHMSCDGSLIAFQSSADLTLNGQNGHVNTFLLDRRDGNKITNITHASNGAALGADISCNGEYVTFMSYATDLDPTVTMTSGGLRSYAYNRIDNKFYLANQDSNGNEANGGIPYNPYSLTGSDNFTSVSDDGRIVFLSDASNLDSKATSNRKDVFVRDTNTGTTELVSQSTSGTDANADSYGPSVSADGKVAGYGSNATNLVTNDNFSGDAFVSKLE